MSRSRELLVALLAALVVTTVVTYPWVFRMGRSGRLDSYDGQFSIWNVAWVARTLVVDPVHVFDANIFYPHRGTLTYSETNLGAGALAVPAYWASGSPFVAHDSAVLAGFVLSLLSVYFLVDYLVANKWSAAVSAVLFAFCPFVIARTTEIQLLMTFGIPLSMLAFHRLVDRPTVGRGALVGVAMTVQTIFCAYYGVFVVLLVGLSVLTAAVWRGVWRERSYWKAVAVGFGIALVLVLPLFFPYFLRQREFGFNRSLDEAARYASDWRSYLASGALAHRWLLNRIGHWRDVDFPGVLGALLGPVGLYAAWRAAGRDREVGVLYGGAVAIFAWASFGPDAGLYTLMYRTIPAFTMMRAPSRFGVLVAFGVSVLVGFAVRFLVTRARRPALVGSVLLVAAILDVISPLKFPRVPQLNPAYSVLSKQPRGVVVEVPYPEAEDAIRNARYMLSSTAHWMPLVNGFSDWLPPDWVADASAIAQFPSAASLELLKQKNAQYAVVHLEFYDITGRVDLEARLAGLAQYLQPLYEDHDTRLYRIVAPPR